MKEKIAKFFRDEEGLTTVEYAVAGALITVAVVTAFTTLGGSVAGTIAIIDGVLPG
jgi:pilus assembly protein Flp/PilA